MENIKFSTFFDMKKYVAMIIVGIFVHFPSSKVNKCIMEKKMNKNSRKNLYHTIKNIFSIKFMKLFSFFFLGIHILKVIGT